QHNGSIGLWGERQKNRWCLVQSKSNIMDALVYGKRGRTILGRREVLSLFDFQAQR
ncbi:unnamed protein product, partial [Ilex paraguariensis]